METLFDVKTCPNWTRLRARVRVNRARYRSNLYGHVKC
jgi:hypothetical protein